MRLTNFTDVAHIIIQLQRRVTALERAPGKEEEPTPTERKKAQWREASKKYYHKKKAAATTPVAQPLKDLF